METIQNTIADNESHIDSDSYFNNSNILHVQNGEQDFIKTRLQAIDNKSILEYDIIFQENQLYVFPKMQLSLPQNQQYQSIFQIA